MSYRESPPDEVWWKNLAKNRLYDIENEDSGIITLMGRGTTDGWEYAIVMWVRGDAILMSTFINGIVKEGV